MSVSEPSDPGPNIDWFIFICTAVVIVGVCAPLILFPEKGAQSVSAAFDFVTTNFGVFYIWSASAAVLFLLCLALGRHGRIRLGPEGCQPDFSTFSWAAMLFCGGIGSTVLYWGTIEWAYYYQAPPFDEAPGSAAAIQWAISYPIFHWGITGWAFYCLPAIAMAHAYHVRDQPSLRVSSACRAVMGAQTDGVLGRTVDLLFMVGLVGAAATGVGLSAPLITASISRFADIPEEFYMSLIVVLLGTLLFCGKRVRRPRSRNPTPQQHQCGAGTAFSRVRSRHGPNAIHSQDHDRCRRICDPKFHSNDNLDRSADRLGVRRKLDDLLLGMVARAGALHGYFREQDLTRPDDPRDGLRNARVRLPGLCIVLFRAGSLRVVPRTGRFRSDPGYPQ